MIEQEKKLKKIQELANKHSITGYDIWQNTSLSKGTAYKILEKNSNKTTRTKNINIALEYLLGFEDKNYPDQEWHTENQIKKGATAREENTNYENKKIKGLQLQVATLFEKVAVLEETLKLLYLHLEATELEEKIKDQIKQNQLQKNG